MQSLSARTQWLIAATLVLLMLVTRGHNPLSIHSLPTASWAIFFLAGVYLRGLMPLLGLFTLVWAMDFGGYTWAGGPDFCLSHSYAYLLVSYAIYWGAGKLYSLHFYSEEWLTLAPLAGISLASGVIGYFVSAASFHFLSGKYPEPDWEAMMEQFWRLLPGNLENLAFYLAITVIIHSVMRLSATHLSRVNSHKKDA